MIPPWRRRQIAERRVARFGGLQETAVAALGFGEAADREDDLVGWMVPVVHTVRGSGHVCVLCQPDQPAGRVPVYRQQLAATHGCRLCGRVLEQVDPREVRPL